MKKSILAFTAAIALAFSMSAVASGNHGNNGNNGNVNVGGEVSIYGGSVSAGVSSISKGEAVSATLISGQGWSNQSTIGTTNGVSQAGGVVNSNGVGVSTSTLQATDFHSVGSIGGGAQAVNGGSQILNGTQGFGSVENVATGSGSFNKGAIGGAIGINGLNSIGNLPGF